MAMSRYRADVDGLRAIAVLAVVLFHGGFGMPGGFVGVDVFFVISGFLITSIIASDLDRGEFSLVSFWGRRVRRIWPAATVVTIASLVAGWFLLVPLDYSRTAGDAVAQVTMLANIRFWLRLDYFAESVDLVPLLHMWSLAVEEQFYLFFPLLLVVLHPLGRRVTVLALSAVALMSLFHSIALVPTRPMAAFFLLPARSWELLLGSVLALAPSPRLSRLSSEWLGGLGVLFILIPCVLFDRTTPFPGLAALPPCIGAALLIAAGTEHRSTLQRFLGWEPIRAVGLASYSIYLWHWPVFAFLRQVYGLSLPTPVLLVSLVLISILSWASYRFVETPCRRMTSDAGKWTVVVGASAASIAILAVSLALNRAVGVPGRFPKEAIALVESDGVCRDWGYDEQLIDKIRSTESLTPIGSPSEGVQSPCFLFLGDSHAMALSPAIDAAARRRGVVGQCLLVSNFLALPGVWVPGTDPSRAFDIAALRRKSEEWIREHKPRHVIVCCRWSGNLGSFHPDSSGHFMAIEGTTDSSEDGAIAALRKGIENLADTCQAIDAKLWFLCEVPYQRLTPWQRIYAARYTASEGVCYGSTDELQHEIVRKRVMSGLPLTGNGRAVRVVDLSTPLFDKRGRSMIGAFGRLWYADDDHLNPVGAQEATGGVVDDIMETISDDCAPKR